MTTTQSPPPAAATTHGQGRWLNAVSGGFLALVLIGGLGVVLWPNGDQTTPRTAADPAVAGAATVPGQDGIPTTAPTDVTWELVSGRAVPRSATAGPTKITGPVHAGYAHTPTGAVLAALNISTRSVLTLGPGWLKVTQAQVAPGRGRDVFVASRKGLGTLTPPVEGWGQTAGFRITSYSPTRAVIEKATRYASGAMQTQPATVIWQDGDWHLLLQPDGYPGPDAVQLVSLDGYTAFASGAL